MLIVKTDLAVSEGSFLQNVGECLPHRIVSVESSRGSQSKEADLVQELWFVDKINNFQLFNKKFARCDGSFRYSYLSAWKIYLFSNKSSASLWNKCWHIVIHD